MSEPSLPSGPLAFVFPGQGSQFVGMGGELASLSERAAGIFDRADELLGFSLSSLMAEGPADVLGDTYKAQVAILVASVAALEAVRERLEERDLALEPNFVAGHSLGEFTALVAAESLDLPTAVHLVRERGRLMREAGVKQPGGMAAVIGLDDECIAEICGKASSAGVVVPANRNCPGQIVISGNVEGLEAAMSLAKERGAKRVARLGVSIASHSPLMAEANRAFLSVIDQIDLKEPSIPMIGNVSAQPLTTVDGIREELREQMERPVDWTGTILTMVALGVRSIVEIGPGTVLTGLTKRIDRNLNGVGIGDLGLGLHTLSSR
jgi:[acyl-carrier-protein] S-malonyltransferase